MLGSKMLSVLRHLNLVGKRIALETKPEGPKGLLGSLQKATCNSTS